MRPWREGGSECTVGTRVGATVGRGGGDQRHLLPAFHRRYLTERGARIVGTVWERVGQTGTEGGAATLASHRPNGLPGHLYQYPSSAASPTWRRRGGRSRDCCTFALRSCNKRCCGQRGNSRRGGGGGFGGNNLVELLDGAGGAEPLENLLPRARGQQKEEVPPAPPVYCKVNVCRTTRRIDSINGTRQLFVRRMCPPASVRGGGRAGGACGGLRGATPACLDKDKDRTKIKANQASIYRFVDSPVRSS